MDREIETWIKDMRRIGVVNTPLETMLAEDLYTIVRIFERFHVQYDVDVIWGVLLKDYGLPIDFYTWVRNVLSAAKTNLEIEKNLRRN